MFVRTYRMATAAVVVLAIAATAVFAATAGPRGGIKARGVAPLQRFSNQLGLSQDQTAKVRAILVDFRGDAKAVLQSERTREAKAAEVMRLRDDAKSAINAVLTLSQQEKAEKGKLVEKLLMPRKAMGMQRLFARLNLAPDQKTKVREIMKDSAQSMKSVRQDNGLSREQKMTRIRDIRRGTIDKISALLTPAQKDKLDQWIKAHQRRGPGRV